MSQVSLPKCPLYGTKEVEWCTGCTGSPTEPHTALGVWQQDLPVRGTAHNFMSYYLLPDVGAGEFLPFPIHVCARFVNFTVLEHTLHTWSH